MDRKKSIKKDDITKNNEKKPTGLLRFFKSGENYIGNLSRKTKELARILEREKRDE